MRGVRCGVCEIGDVKYSMYVVAERILWLETHDESAGRVYRRHGRVAVDRIGHLSSGTTPGTTKGDTHTGKHTVCSDTTPTLTMTLTHKQGLSRAPRSYRAHAMT